MAQHIRVCIVGTAWGHNLGTMIRRAAPNCEIFVCGRDSDKTTRVAKALGASGTFQSLDEVMADSKVQGVVLALPHHLHRRAAEESLKAGKHVFVEKPMTTSLADADAMIATAARAGRTLMVSDNLHCQPAIIETRRRLENGSLGRPLHLLANSFGLHQPEQGWRMRQGEMGGGLLMDAGVRPIRAMRLLLGEPESVFAVRGPQVNAAMEGEDNVHVIFSGEPGWKAHVLLSWAARRGNLPEYVLLTEKASLHMWMNAGHMDVYPAAPGGMARAVSHVRPYWLKDRLSRPWMERTRVRLTTTDVSGHSQQMKEFLTAIESGSASHESAQQGRRDLEIILQAYRSMEIGSPVAARSQQLAGISR